MFYFYCTVDTVERVNCGEREVLSLTIVVRAECLHCVECVNCGECA